MLYQIQNILMHIHMYLQQYTTKLHCRHKYKQLVSLTPAPTAHPAISRLIRQYLASGCTFSHSALLLAAALLVKSRHLYISI